MRTRLVHTLSLWLLGAVALSVLSMGGLTAWNLRQGFSAYLQARDIERLDTFVDLVASRMAGAQDGSGATPMEPDMPALLRALDLQQGSSPTPRPPSPRPDAGGPDRPEGPFARPPAGGPALPHGPGPGAEERFGSRVSLALPDGRHWAGPPVAPGESGLIERPVRVRGEVVALVRLRPLAPAPDASEARFLRSQYLGIALLAGVLLLLALAGAVWLARQWVRPLHAMQEATARIAQGELAVRVGVVRGDEIGDLVRNVNAMAESLQRIEGARRRWLADLSHELRTPLTVLRGDIEALVDGVRPLTAQAVTMLREDVLRLGRLVEELHLLAIADLQPLPCHFGHADAAQIVREAVQRHARAAAEAGLVLQEMDVPAHAVPVLWDATRIAQLLGNLLQNSLRYTDAPGTVAVSLQLLGERVQVCVDDTAPGVPDADLARVFEPLWRADPARGRHDGGSGLGLAICEAIAKAHGGHIRASASALGGLRIVAELPVHADRAGA